VSAVVQDALVPWSAQRPAGKQLALIDNSAGKSIPLKSPANCLYQHLLLHSHKSGSFLTGQLLLSKNKSQPARSLLEEEWKYDVRVYTGGERCCSWDLGGSRGLERCWEIGLPLKSSQGRLAEERLSMIISTEGNSGITNQALAARGCWSIYSSPLSWILHESFSLGVTPGETSVGNGALSLGHLSSLLLSSL